MKKSLLHCNTVDEMLAVSRLPMHLYPTIASSMRNIELPLNKDDYEWITGNKVHVFHAADSPRQFTRSNLSPPTFSPDDPIIVTGVCVFMYPEPYSTVLEGNTFGPHTAITAATGIPASPINLRKDNAFLNALFTGGVRPAGLEACAAHLDFGGPTWRLTWALLQAMRLQFNCPNSSLETLINERLVDVGNACARVEFEGLSNARTPHTFLTRRYNARVPNLQLPDSYESSDGATSPANVGYFLPISCEQLADGQIVPNRMTAPEAAYGQPNALPSVETWYRLPYPMPMDQNTKIQMYMEPSAGDENYRTRMIDEGILRQCASPIQGIAGTFPLIENNANNTGDASFSQIPAGMIRIGLGLKGFQVREGVCHQYRRALNDKNLVAQLMNGNYSPMAGVADECVALGMSGPSDLGSKIIDTYMSHSGPVGDEE